VHSQDPAVLDHGSAFGAGSDPVNLGASPASAQLPAAVPITPAGQKALLVGSAFGDANNAEGMKSVVMPATPAHMSSLAATWKGWMMRGVDYDIHCKVKEDPLVAAIHANAEKWDPDTEFVFGFLQVAH
jgi:hypothetical protein